MKFEIRKHYFGLISDEIDINFPSRLYAFERLEGSPNADSAAACQGFVFKDDGALYGFVSNGKAFFHVTDKDGSGTMKFFIVEAGEYFSFAGIGQRVEITVPKGGACFVAQRKGFRATNVHGGRIEFAGRLRYIDGCSDSVLIPPQVLGDPCLNHLHFPTEINQTMHTHPSVRVGTVARGNGYCITPEDSYELTEGALWIIPPGIEHLFRTTGSSLDVVPYHPDSDFGPTHQTHPMVNRTIVGGEKIDNTTDRHIPKDLVDGWVK